MSDFRFPYGVALGTYGNFSVRTDNLLGTTDTTPDVSLGSLFWAGVGHTATISYFDGRLTGGVTGVEEGKLIKVIFLGTGSTLTNSADLNLENDVNYEPGIGDSIELVHHASAWFEIGRTWVTPTLILAQSGDLGAAAAPRLLITQNTHTVTCLARASSLMTIDAMPGGYDGQRVTIISVGSQVTLSVNSAGVADGFLATSGGTTYVINGSFGATCIRATFGGTAKWVVDAPSVSADHL